MLQRKRPRQTQAQNNGGQPRGNRAICMQLFAVSRTTKANQRNLNGGWQASTNAFALCPCQPSPLCLPSINGPVFFFERSNIPPLLSPEDFVRVEGWSRLHSHTENTSLNLLRLGLALAAAKRQHVDTIKKKKKPPLSLRFISRVLKAAKCNSADRFRCTHLGHSATSNFKGVDRKQNMYYEVVGWGGIVATEL